MQKFPKNSWFGKPRVSCWQPCVPVHFTTCLGVREIEIENATQAIGSRDDGSTYYGLLVQSRYGHGAPTVR